MRARNLKPGIFKNEILARLGSNHLVLFEGLWCLADREGRLEDRPERIEAEIFPFKFQKVNVPKMLDDLAQAHPPFICRYTRDQQAYIQVLNFKDHQNPHIKEAPSRIQPIPKTETPDKSGASTVPAPDKHHANTILARLNPDVLNPESPLLTADNTSRDHAPKNGGMIAMPASPKFGPEDVMNLWNEKAHPNIRRVEILNRGRETHLKTCLRNFPDREFWEKLIERINHSTFLTGQARPRQGSDKAFVVYFDWILSLNNLTKIIEGNYDDAASPHR